MEGIDADWLWGQLRSVDPQVTVLDCRTALDFSECHIRQAVHLSLPSIMLRRLAGGKVTIGSVLKCNEARQRLAQAYGKHTFVLCGDTPLLPTLLPPPPLLTNGATGAEVQLVAPPPTPPPPREMMPVLHKSLLQDGCLVVCLQGGIEEFRNKYPEWCVIKESDKKDNNSGHPAGLRMDSGLKSRNSGSSSGLRPMNRRPGSLGSRSASDSEEERPDSSLDPADGHPPEFGCGFSLGLSVGLRLGLESEALLPPLDHAMDHSLDVDPDPGFPVEILPHLFLGNAQNSSDCDALDKHHIRFVVNVTPNLPNVFEDSGSIQYLQIPITDHWSQNLASFFPSAISFIDGARERGEGVLVHCLAGISRSVTITVAYLMYKKSMSLNDAYDFVRRKKANISPNFNFMGQLLDFEHQLNPQTRCTCHLPPSSESPLTSPLPPLPESSSANAAAANAAGSKSNEMVIPFQRLSIEEKDEDDDVDDSGLLPSVSPFSASSSGSSGSSGSSKRLRTLVCRCQASLSQCHFTTPTTL